MVSGNLLLTAKPPWVLRADFGNERIIAMLAEAGRAGLVATIDGDLATSSESLFSVFARTLDFPSYFGANWSALKDCLTDLDWLPADIYVIAVVNARSLLVQEPVERASLIQIMETAGREWATPVELGEWWDRPAKPFHIILDQSAAEWSAEQLTEIVDIHPDSGDGCGDRATGPWPSRTEPPLDS